jgi:hypothetical protein
MLPLYQSDKIEAKNGANSALIQDIAEKLADFPPEEQNAVISVLNGEKREKSAIEAGISPARLRRAMERLERRLATWRP